MKRRVSLHNTNTNGLVNEMITWSWVHEGYAGIGTGQLHGHTDVVYGAGEDNALSNTSKPSFFRKGGPSLIKLAWS
jgi:hypothetical protein